MVTQLISSLVILGDQQLYVFLMYFLFNLYLR